MVLATLLAVAGGLHDDLVKQHNLMFASYMDQDDEADGFHTEDFEAELQHVRRQHDRLTSAGATRPTLGPLIEQALSDPQSLERITESIANLGADGDANAHALHQQLLDADPTLGAGWEERRRLRDATTPTPGGAGWGDTQANWAAGMRVPPGTVEAGDGWTPPPDLSSARGAPGFGYRAGGLKPVTMSFRPDIDHAAHQLRRDDYRSDEL